MQVDQTTFPLPQEPGKLSLSLPCHIGEVRPASATLRQYLQDQGLTEVELSACELAVVEGLNNAIEYASQAGATFPVQLEANCTAEFVLFQITDHTEGFVLPDPIELPPFEAERGRGLYLIKSAMDQMNYETCPGGNRLTISMYRKRG